MWLIDGRAESGYTPYHECASRYECDTMVNPRTVLIVDDNASVRFMLRFALTSEDYLTLEAVDGVEAVAALSTSPVPLVVLLDLLMPRMTGLDVLDLVDASKELTRHAYIVMTSD